MTTADLVKLVESSRALIVDDNALCYPSVYYEMADYVNRARIELSWCDNGNGRRQVIQEERVVSILEDRTVNTIVVLERWDNQQLTTCIELLDTRELPPAVPVVAKHKSWWDAVKDYFQ